MSGPPEHDPYQALGPSGFRRFVTGHVVAIIGFQMQGVAVGWELYERTHSALALGLVGLGQVIPMILFSLPAGHLVDRFDRRGVLLASLAGIALAAVGLAAFSATEGPVPVYYALLFLSGAARAVFGPAKSALLPEMVPLPSFQSAVAWSSGGWQVAAVLGPAIGGGLLTVTGTPALVYLSHALLALVFVALMWGVRSPTQVRLVAAPTLDSLWDGARYVIRSKILLAAITLDLFAVLLGGAVALLPVYAKDILHVGPAGLGWLLAVALFGIATIVFGLSRSFLLSLAALAVAGAAESVSVVIRMTLAQLGTPNELRGRVSAVNSLFIGTSNELGHFESGAMQRIEDSVNG